MKQRDPHPLLQVIRQHKQGQANGVYSICSSNRFVLEAALLEAKRNETDIYIESTSNQVNQEGGYTHMVPGQFAAMVSEIAQALDFPPERVVLGGDHLGPNVWQDQVAETAMRKACALVRDCVRAGYTKIHLDASMRLADDPEDPHSPLDPQVVAERAAQLCQTAEEAFGESNGSGPAPVYIIGTEVPVPGGAQAVEEGLSVTPASEASRTIDLNYQAFLRLGLEEAWGRVCAVVVQPGVEFGDDTVHDYERLKATALSRHIETNDQFIYEAHSTDYQTPENMKQMVADHFAILKVGPWLTYACREALVALESIEQELLAARADLSLSVFRETLEQVMLDDPRYWEKYYRGNPPAQRLARLYSYSDRWRYYWPHPDIQQAVLQLLRNLENESIPLSLLHQFLPCQYTAVRAGCLQPVPLDLIRDKIMQVTGIYAFACNHRPYE